MQVLTPSGYKHPSALANGDDVCAFDMVTGAAIINQIENIDFVDYAEWCRWWIVEDAVPPFNWVRINDKHILFGEQSVWRNGTNVCHAKDIAAGDVIYDSADQVVHVASVELLEDQASVWYRFDISGDHSYIVDGLTVHNASRFWVGGTGTWDAATTTHWAATTGAAGGQSVPGSADTVTFDASSGGGTVTVNFGGTVTIQSLATPAFTGTWDNSVNNNNFALSAGTNAFNNSGAGVRSIKLGSATYTLSASNANWSFTTTTGLTFTGSSASIVFTDGFTATRTFSGGGLTYGSLTLGSNTTSGTYTFSGNNTFSSVAITAPNFVQFSTGSTNTISSAVAWNGSASAKISIFAATIGSGTAATLGLAAASAANWCAFYGMAVTGSPAVNNSFDLGNNSGFTISPPNFPVGRQNIYQRGTPF